MIIFILLLIKEFSALGLCTGQQCEIDPSNNCRSQFGSCGGGVTYCNTFSTWDPSCGISTLSPSIYPLACTGDICDNGLCRSQFGFCGSGSSYCNDKSIWTTSCTSTISPSKRITRMPTKRKTKSPTTKRPTKNPTSKPTKTPTKIPTSKATKSPSSTATTKSPTESSSVTKSPSFTTKSPSKTLAPVVTSTKSPSTTTPAKPTVGTVLKISNSISVYLPPTICRPENCPPNLGDCVNNICIPKDTAKWNGLLTHPKAYATYYCELSDPDGCLGVTYANKPHVTATTVAHNFSIPLCQEMGSNKQTCVGIVAPPPIMVGNSQEAIDPATGTFVKKWGLGITEASGICHKIVGPDGNTAIVATTDRCGGYCTCEAQSSKAECGPCVNKNLVPGCPCVGSVGSTQCCGLSIYGCAALDNECDWCASNNHPHFDLDTATFNYVCGTKAGAGSCELKSVTPVACMNPVKWPPGGGGAASCGANAFACSSSPDPNQPEVPGCGCCCYWGLTPHSDDCSCV